MDFTAITTAIGTIGFPIVACIFLYKYMTETMKENNTALNQLSDTITELKTTMQTLTDYILNGKDS